MTDIIIVPWFIQGFFKVINPFIDPLVSFLLQHQPIPSRRNRPNASFWPTC